MLGLIMRKMTALILSMLLVAFVQVAFSMPAAIHIGHGLIGDLNPRETGAIVLGSYFDPEQVFYDNGKCESRQFDHWRLDYTGFYWWAPEQFCCVVRRCV
jgi:hypothetical protein